MTRDTVDEARRLVERSANVVVLTGAGVSTASGIPDFRGPDGVWTKNPAAERLSNIDAFTSSAEIRERAWGQLLARSTIEILPNQAHYALVEFERSGTLSALVTQNIDGLHVKAGSDPSLVIEVHGNSRTTRCLSCGDELPTATVLERVADGERDPHCRAMVQGVECGGLLKTAVVSFGQALPAGDFARAEYLAKTCDLLICIGSTLSVRPVSGLVPKALDRGARLIIINAEPTPFDDAADVVLRGDIPTVLESLFGPIAKK
ncbi:MAG: Sir2 family NAD-dependent protein deacetylase [Acidimicrobiales bacterium]